MHSLAVAIIYERMQCMQLADMVGMNVVRTFRWCFDKVCREGSLEGRAVYSGLYEGILACRVVTKKPQSRR